jgi:hypothetical protein
MTRNEKLFFVGFLFDYVMSLKWLYFETEKFSSDFPDPVMANVYPVRFENETNKTFFL